LERTKKDFVQTQCALKDATNKVNEMQHIALKQASQSHANCTSIVSKNLQEIESIQEKNSQALTSLCKIRMTATSQLKLQLCAKHNLVELDIHLPFLLAEHISPAKIGPVIKTILKGFFPDLDTDQLKLPIKSDVQDLCG